MVRVRVRGLGQKGLGQKARRPEGQRARGREGRQLCAEPGPRRNAPLPFCLSPKPFCLSPKPFWPQPKALLASAQSPSGLTPSCLSPKPRTSAPNLSPEPDTRTACSVVSESTAPVHGVDDSALPGLGARSFLPDRARSLPATVRARSSTRVAVTLPARKGHEQPSPPRPPASAPSSRGLPGCHRAARPRTRRESSRREAAGSGNAGGEERVSERGGSSGAHEPGGQGAGVWIARGEALEVAAALEIAQVAGEVDGEVAERGIRVAARLYAVLTGLAR